MAAGLALVIGAGAPAGADTNAPGLSSTLDQILADTRLDGAQVGVVVRDAETGETLYDHNGSLREVPASSTKLITSAAAMALLGPDYRFSTDVLTTGSQRGPVLHGDLYLRGTGDPTMLAEDYDQLAAEIAAAGIHRVDGDLVADDTRFDNTRLGFSWAWDDEPYYYSSQISPLTVAPNTDYDAGNVIVHVEPGAAAGDQAKVSLQPATDYVTIDNRVTTVAAGGARSVDVEREHGTNTIHITGTMPTNGAASDTWSTVSEPTGLAADVFAKALKAHGVKLSGRTRLGEATPQDAQTLATHPSMSLKDLLTPFLKLSNNNHAEVLVKAIGYQLKGSGSWSAGLSAIGGFLRTVGIDPTTLRQVDGSGLSRADMISPAQFATLLSAVRSEPWFQDWYDALPIACNPDRMGGGTLRSRMCGTPAAVNLHGKTGSMTGVSGLSGYVTDADGRKLVFSMLSNDYVSSSVKGVEDAVGAALASYSVHSTAAPALRSRSAVEPSSGNRATDDGAALECSWLKPATC
ncbi:D-alanyl-D-alanine carboxypeptidase/D-alanyl-D-alanine-endopeptidase [Peterkaempfera sp. SMS 1(5)a]|uniref:D-alanyl-D-alanine carboxypeptidase/D-alanyl-D-alanine endopeptidase n=1 Tax=Peterkaempfera podocarpi TaxID=3232308 RepID=UPI00366BB4CD